MKKSTKKFVLFVAVVGVGVGAIWLLRRAPASAAAPTPSAPAAPSPSAAGGAVAKTAEAVGEEVQKVMDVK